MAPTRSEGPPAGGRRPSLPARLWSLGSLGSALLAVLSCAGLFVVGLVDHLPYTGLAWSILAATLLGSGVLWVALQVVRWMVTDDAQPERAGARAARVTAGSLTVLAIAALVVIGLDNYAGLGLSTGARSVVVTATYVLVALSVAALAVALTWGRFPSTIRRQAPARQDQPAHGGPVRKTTGSTRRAAPAAAPSPAQGWSRWWPLLLTSGWLLGVLAVTMTWVYAHAFVWRGEELGGIDLPFVDEYPTVTEIMLPPMPLFLGATVLLFLGEMLRRGTISAAGPKNIAVFRPLASWAHALWALGLLAAWAAVVPFLLSRSSTEAGSSVVLSYLGPDDDVIFLAGFYGGLLAALVGAVAASLFKKAWYRRAIARGLDGPTSEFWTWFTFTWRFDLWLVALGTLLLGLVPFPWFFGSTTMVVLVGGCGAVLTGVGLVTSTFYRLAGAPLGTAVSSTAPPTRARQRA